jgi:hypothetical protein
MNCDLERKRYASFLPSIWDESVESYKNSRFHPHIGILLSENLEIGYWIELYMPQYYKIWRQTSVGAEIQLADLDSLVEEKRQTAKTVDSSLVAESSTVVDSHILPDLSVQSIQLPAVDQSLVSNPWSDAGDPLGAIDKF